MKLFTEREELAILGMLDTTRNIDSHRLVHGGTGDCANTLFAKITLIFPWYKIMLYVCLFQ